MYFYQLKKSSHNYGRDDKFFHGFLSANLGLIYSLLGKHLCGTTQKSFKNYWKQQGNTNKLQNPSFSPSGYFILRQQFVWNLYLITSTSLWKLQTLDTLEIVSSCTTPGTHSSIASPPSITSTISLNGIIFVRITSVTTIQPTTLVKSRRIFQTLTYIF